MFVGAVALSNQRHHTTHLCGVDSGVPQLPLRVVNRNRELYIDCSAYNSLIGGHIITTISTYNDNNNLTEQVT